MEGRARRQEGGEGKIISQRDFRPLPRFASGIGRDPGDR